MSLLQEMRTIDARASAVEDGRSLHPIPSLMSLTGPKIQGPKRGLTGPKIQESVCRGGTKEGDHREIVVFLCFVDIFW